MEQILVSWIGGNDLNALSGSGEATHKGPLISALEAVQPQTAYLLYNYPSKEVKPYLEQLKKKSATEINARYAKLTSPIDFSDIYQASSAVLSEVFSKHRGKSISILLSPGTPAMQAVWILLGKTKYPAIFFQSSVQQGVQQVRIPFDISAEFLPQIETRSGQRVSALAAAEVPVDAAFDDILTQSPNIQSLKAEASLMALRDVPVLIYGETGTGKELFARAIHHASGRSGESFIPVNCGAIPAELIDSILFGHVKGAFTDAKADKSGLFVEADKGTIFLDEFGELPSSAQVRLLRVLNDGEITPVGANKARRIDVRVVAATNRNLMECVGRGEFRDDLFYRVAVGVLNLPPLRDREGDVGMLADRMLEQINQQAASLPGYTDKKYSSKAKNIILKHRWPGNIRELYSTILRATIWPKSDTISEGDISRAILNMPAHQEGVLGRDIENNFIIQSVIDEVQEHYIRRALALTGGRKKRAAEILGLNNYQTLDKRMEKLGIK